MVLPRQRLDQPAQRNLLRPTSAGGLQPTGEGAASRDWRLSGVRSRSIAVIGQGEETMTRSGIHLLLALALCMVVLGTTARVAGAIDLQFKFQGTAAPSTLELLATPVDAPPTIAARRIALRGETKGPVDLDPAFEWHVENVTSGYWSAGAVVPKGAASDLALEVSVFEAARLRAFLAVERGEALPREVDLRFVSPPGAKPAEAIPEGTVTCPVKEGLVECVLPSGRLDVRLRAKGFVSQLFWNQSLDPGKPLDLGRLALRAGASVFGQVASTQLDFDPKKAKVLLFPYGSGPRNAADEERIQRSGVTEKLDSRGSFHFEGIGPGTYRLEAHHPGLAPAELAPVVVEARSETDIRRPLVLEPYRQLSVDVTPPRDLAGGAWHVEANRVSQPGGSLEEKVTLEMRDGGEFIAPKLLPGEYFVRVISSEGESLAMKEIEIGSGDETVRFDLDFVPLKGSITFGGDPIAADLTFGGKRGVPRVAFRSDSKGSFSGYLPRSGNWRVDVFSSEPAIQRSLPKVEVRARPGASSALVDIRLRATRVEGVVVDEADTPVPSARVVSLGEGEILDTRTDEKGKFLLLGLDEGMVPLQATTRDQQSLLEFVNVSEDSPANVRIVLRKQTEVVGRVVRSGVGVPGAQVFALPVGAQGFGNAGQSTTDLDGNFRLKVSGASNGLTFVAMPPGSRLVVRQTAGDKGPVILESRWGGGDLSLKFRDRKPEDGPLQPIDLGHVVVYVDGSPISATMLEYWGRLNGRKATEGLVEFPALPPGNLVACRFGSLPALVSGVSSTSVSSTNCVSGFLMEGSQLTLEP